MKMFSRFVFAFFGVSLLPALAFAQEMGGNGGHGAASNEFSMKAALAIGAGIAVGMGVLGATLAQGRAASSALESIGRNPGAAAKIQTPMILGLALIESLALLAFLIAFFLQGKI